MPFAWSLVFLFFGQFVLGILCSISMLQEKKNAGRKNKYWKETKMLVRMLERDKKCWSETKMLEGQQKMLNVDNNVGKNVGEKPKMLERDKKCW